MYMQAQPRKAFLFRDERRRRCRISDNYEQHACLRKISGMSVHTRAHCSQWRDTYRYVHRTKSGSRVVCSKRRLLEESRSLASEVIIICRHAARNGKKIIVGTIETSGPDAQLARLCSLLRGLDISGLEAPRNRESL